MQRLSLFVILFCVLSVSAPRAAEPEPYMPKSLPEFVTSLQMSLAQNLPRDEFLKVSSLSPDELRERHPDLYGKIHYSIKIWTDRWVARALKEMEIVPERRIERATESAIEVDRRLRTYFEANGWPYRTLSVVLLPQKLLYGNGNSKTLGMYIPFYPDAFFASVDPNSTIEHTLVHESLHFNKTGQSVGHALAEGITEVASEQLVIEWGLVRRGQLRRRDYYPDEQKLVEYILERMQVRSERSDRELLEILLRCYLTGDFGEMNEIFGEEAWTKVVTASRARRSERKAAKRALGD